MPGAPRAALTVAYAAAARAIRLSLALVIRSDNGGTIPGKNHPFITRVEPDSPPYEPRREFGGGAGNCPRVRYAYSEWRLSP